MPIDIAKLEHATILMLEAVGEDATRDGLLKTPSRVAKAWREMLAGYDIDPIACLSTSFELDDTDAAYDQIILSRDIPFTSYCEHHIMPFKGIAHVAYIPSATGRVVGLSKLARVVDAYARRLQVQERLTQQIADAVNKLDTVGTAVIVKSRHSCQHDRGIRKDGYMVTSALYGAFRSNRDARAELMELIKL